MGKRAISKWTDLILKPLQVCGLDSHSHSGFFTLLFKINIIYTHPKVHSVKGSVNIVLHNAFVQFLCNSSDIWKTLLFSFILLPQTQAACQILQGEFFERQLLSTVNRREMWEEGLFSNRTILCSLLSDLHQRISHSFSYIGNWIVLNCLNHHY